MSGKGIPRLSESLLNSNDFVPPQDIQLLKNIQDEVRDAQRVQRQGQEEDLRYALGLMVSRVEELVRIWNVV